MPHLSLKNIKKGKQVLNKLKSKMIPDISRKSYDKRTFPKMYAQECFSYKGVLWITNEEVSVYNYNYSTLVNWMKSNKINTQKFYLIKNAPCL